MFSGRFDHAVDEKGRVSIPAKFREILQREGDDRLFITNTVVQREKCLELFPPSEWDKVVERFNAVRNADQDAQLYETFYIGGAHELQVDKQGRILIPPRLRGYAHLDRDVTFSAKHNRFELWDKGTLERLLTLVEEKLQDPQFLAKISI